MAKILFIYLTIMVSLQVGLDFPLDSVRKVGRF